ncbi:MAG: hypothetical protein QXS20_09970 [Candidatus Thorarchaeota archaeon]
MEKGLRVRAVANYGRLGLVLLFGWAASYDRDDDLAEFRSWVESTPFASCVFSSIMTSSLDEKLYFEALVPIYATQFWSKLDKFAGSQDGLSIEYDIAKTLHWSLNMGICNGHSWEIPDVFTLLASIETVSSYVEVLPGPNPMDLSRIGHASPEQLLLGLCIERTYRMTATEAQRVFEEFEVRPPSLRTLRRRLSAFRATASLPYVEIDNIGLTQRVIILVAEQPNRKRASLVLHAESGHFPSTLTISGDRLTALELGLPENFRLSALNTLMAETIGNSADVSVLAIPDGVKRKGLEQVVPYLLRSPGAPMR